MKITNIEIGMMLHVHSDISSTKSKWTLDKEGRMLKMRGNIYRVQYIQKSRNGVTLHDPDHNETWIFSAEDLSIPNNKTKAIPPVMFDPTNIIE